MVIIDTSVAYKWFDESEINSDLALGILNSHLSNKQEIFVPDLLLYELANAWSMKGRLGINQIKDNLTLFKQYNLQIIPVTLDLIEKAVALSKNNQVSVYDATYAVLAQEKKCQLITADEKLADKINSSFILKLSQLQGLNY